MKHNLKVEAHLDEEILIRLLDGELDKRAASPAVRHLKSCWTCRQRREQLRLAMDRFVEFEQALTGPSVTAPPQEWASFRPLLRQAAMQNSPEPKASAWAVAIRAVAVFGVAAALIFSITPAAPVSAKEILDRSASSEEHLLAKTNNPLVMQQLRVESPQGAASWSLWQAPVSGQFHEAWNSQSGEYLRSRVESLYANQGLDLRRPLSAANHSRWRRSLKHSTDSVIEEDGLLRVLTHNDDPLAPGEISEAQLSVRRSDLRPVEERFRVAGTGPGGELRIIEASYRIETLNAENARIFESSAPAFETAPVVVARLAAPPAESFARIEAPVKTGAEQIALADAEVEALALLHEIEADRLESAEVERGEASVLVTAYAATRERKEIIENRLSAVHGLQLVVHLLSESQLPSADLPLAIVDSGPPSMRESPLFLDSLIRLANSPEAANELVTRQMDLLGQLAIELHSVESLSNRFPEHVRTALSPHARKRLDALAFDHLTSARRLWNELDRSDAPLSAAIAAPVDRQAGVNQQVCSEWYRPESVPVPAARRLEELYVRAFTTSMVNAPSGISKESIRNEVGGLRAEIAQHLAEVCLY